MADSNDPLEATERSADVTSGIAGLRHRLRYRFDNLLARGTWPVLVWLGAITFGAIVLSALLLAVFQVTFTGSEDGSWLEDFWQSLLRVLDTGTMAADVGWGRRVLALAITLFGVLVAGTLIGVIASGVEQRIDRMRKGRSVVIESDHIVVLGASERIPLLLQQFVLADAARHDSAIVVLANCDPTELSDAVGRVVDDTLGSRLVFRSGDPTSTSDLELVRLDRARAVVVLADADGQDSRAVKTVLAVGARLDGFDAVPIVVELHHTSNAESLVEACGPAIHPIIAAQAAARVASFALRQRGLSQVIGELLDYRGSDVHISDQDDLAGMSFADVLGRYAKARPIGIVRTAGPIELNPDRDARFERGDRLVVVADDAQQLELAPPGAWDVRDPSRRPDDLNVDVGVDLASDDQHLLVIGWNALGVQLLTYWAMITSAASTVEIAYDADLVSPAEIQLPTMNVAEVILTPIHKTAGTTSGFRRRTDDEPPITTVVLLAYADHLSVADADSRTLLDLLVLRRRLAEMSGPRPRVVVEILDVDDLPLARMSGADDYLVSQATGSQFIAQLAEQPERRLVYLQFYAVDGPSIHLVPAERLRLVGEFSTAEVVAATYEVGFVAIGWRRANVRGGELTLNPRLDARIRLEPDDEVVVIG